MQSIASGGSACGHCRARRCSWPSSSATRRRSTAWTVWPAGPPASVIAACRCRPAHPTSSISPRRRRARPIATTWPARWPGTASGSPSCRPTCRASWWPCTRPTTRCSTASRRKSGAATRPAGRRGPAGHAAFSGALAWPYLYPWPQRPRGLVDEAFAELARRWRPILDVFDDCGVDLCYEIHPGEDLHDGATFERFLDAVGHHPRAKILYDPGHLLLQQMDYLGFIDRYHARIGMFHAKDAEYRADARSGVYGGYQDWIDRPGRFRSLGDGQIDFKAIFSKLAQYDFPGWAVLEWECCLKHPEDGAREGAAFIREHLIRVTEHAFDDFADGGASP